MSKIYKELISDLKIILINKNIKFKDLFSLINKQEYDKINEIVQDDTISIIINKIVIEWERIGNNLENIFNDLVKINELLVKFGENPQPSKTKALNFLKRNIFINIYYLEAGEYERKTTKKELIKSLRNNPELRYPLNIAKQYKTLKRFLVNI